MISLSEKETVMVIGGTKNNIDNPKFRLCARCGKELIKESDENPEKRYKGRLCCTCISKIKIPENHTFSI